MHLYKPSLITTRQSIETTPLTSDGIERRGGSRGYVSHHVYHLHEPLSYTSTTPYMTQQKMK